MVPKEAKASRFHKNMVKNNNFLPENFASLNESKSAVVIDSNVER